MLLVASEVGEKQTPAKGNKEQGSGMKVRSQEPGGWRKAGCVSCRTGREPLAQGPACFWSSFCSRFSFSSCFLSSFFFWEMR